MAPRTSAVLGPAARPWRLCRGWWDGALVKPVVGLAINASLWVLWIRLGYNTVQERERARHS
ncbi:MAG TPA: hypothetical protein VM716_09630 [Gemmatimonadales bacterium]|nr:hypothetical protein [Gemmatimonadales bacterium]